MDIAERPIKKQCPKTVCFLQYKTVWGSYNMVAIGDFHRPMAQSGLKTGTFIQYSLSRSGYTIGAGKVETEIKGGIK